MKKENHRDKLAEEIIFPSKFKLEAGVLSMTPIHRFTVINGFSLC